MSGIPRKKVSLQGRISAIDLGGLDSSNMTIDIITRGERLVVFLERKPFRQMMEAFHVTIEDLIGRLFTCYNSGEADEYFSIRSEEDEFVDDVPAQSGPPGNTRS